MAWNTASVLDVTPSEKLQLVQDLWDDLAATPVYVPVHNWQKEESARRRAKLAAHPDLALPWEEVTQRVRPRYAHN